MTTFTTPTKHDRPAGAHFAEPRPRHRAVLAHGSWRRVTRRIVCGLACALTVSSLLMPSVSLAAEWIDVGGSTHNAADGAAGDGSTWSWDGANDLQLNGYNGGGIIAGGKLNVSYEGDNNIASMGEGITAIDGTNESAELNISGTGALTVESDGDGLTSEGDLNISGSGSISVDSANGDGIYADGDLNVEGTGAVEASGAYGGINVNGDVAINTSGSVTAKGESSRGIHANGNIAITGGGVVEAKSETDDGIRAKGTLEISNSTVTAKGTEQGIWAWKGLTIDNATVRAHALGNSTRDTSIAIYTDEGDIVIKNGSLVYALAEGFEGAGISSINYDEGGAGGRIFISDSTVEAIARYLKTEGQLPLPPIAYGDNDIPEVYVVGPTFGIHVMTENAIKPATIRITRSRVIAEGETAAILALVASEDGTVMGTIDFIDSIIETPGGGRVCDIHYIDEANDGMTHLAGQTIGTAEGVIEDMTSDAIAKRAVIVPVEAPKPEAKPEAKTVAAAAKGVEAGSKLAATGDSSAEGIIAAAIAGATAIGAGALTSRKRS